MGLFVVLPCAIAVTKIIGDENMLKSLIALSMLAIFLTIPSSPMDSIESDTGTWPDTWPNELEPLRKQAESGRGGVFMSPFHKIKFTKNDRETFETAWPHILTLKSEGSTLTLIDGNYYFKNAEDVVAGVIISPPMEGTKSGLLTETRISLLVDGNVIDLNRIELPANTRIEDARFKNAR